MSADDVQQQLGEIQARVEARALDPTTPLDPAEADRAFLQAELERRANLEQWVKVEQQDLWGDFAEAQRNAANGAWSMGCEHIARRIVEAARIVGPTPWEQVQWPLVAGGVWHALHETVGIPVDGPTDQQLADTSAAMVRTASMEPAWVYVARFAGTRAAIAQSRLDREGHAPSI